MYPGTGLRALEKRKSLNEIVHYLNLFSRKENFILTESYEILIKRPSLIYRLTFFLIHTNCDIFRSVSVSYMAQYNVEK
jgi:hypothetical protein